MIKIGLQEFSLYFKLDNEVVERHYTLPTEDIAGKICDELIKLKRRTTTLYSEVPSRDYTLLRPFTHNLPKKESERYVQLYQTGSQLLSYE